MGEEALIRRHQLPVDGIHEAVARYVASRQRRRHGRAVRAVHLAVGVDIAGYAEFEIIGPRSGDGELEQAGFGYREPRAARAAAHRAGPRLECGTNTSDAGRGGKGWYV